MKTSDKDKNKSLKTGETALKRYKKSLKIQNAHENAKCP